jgi:hypothetical protein
MMSSILPGGIACESLPSFYAPILRSLSSMSATQG